MAENKLLHVSLALLALNVAHALDHAINQDQGFAAIGAIGGLSILAALVAAGLSVIHSASAAPFVAVLGFGQLAGFLLIHAAPNWGPISDPYFESASVNALSWIVLGICVGVSLYAGVVGLRQMQREPSF